MLNDKRKYHRFNIPLGVKFRPTYGAREYATGDTINISSEGLALNAHDFRFIKYENLEIIINHPGGDRPVSLFGDVQWKKQAGIRCLAGIYFKSQNKEVQGREIQKLFNSLSIPDEEIHRNNISAPSVTVNADELLEHEADKTMVPPKPLNKLGFIKKYNQKGDKCLVTFRLLRELAGNAGSVKIVGDFNNWDSAISPMIRLENGDYTATLELNSKKEYRFRYLIDSHIWENDWYADKYLPNNHGSKDSVVIV